MKQSLLAFLAMSIFSLLALTQQRAAMHYHSLVHGRDYEMAAMNLVSERLSKIETLSFDEADVGIGPNQQRTSTADLSAAFGLETGEPDELFGGYIIAADDIDDYHGFELDALSFDFNGATYAFDIRIDVCYIDALSPASSPIAGQTAEQTAKARCQSAKSLAKQVIVSLNETLPTDMTRAEFTERAGRTPVQVTISRVFSPAGLSFH